MKYKKLTKEQIIISLDRLTRFKNTKEKYIRVFSDILISNLLEPKLKKNDIINLDFSVVARYVSEIINASVDSCPNSNCVNKFLIEYENGLFFNDDDTQKLLNNSINYDAMLDLIPKESPLNLLWLKMLISNRDVLSFGELNKVRESQGLKYPLKEVLLVEGITEEILLPEFAKLLGYDFCVNGVQVLSAGGKNQVVKKYYSLCAELKLPIFVLLDKDAEDNIKQIEPRLRKIDRIHLVSCGEFEDLLPKSLIVRTVNSHFKNFLAINEADFNNNLPTVKTLEEIFKTKGLHEFKKAEFAKLVKENILTKEDASVEIKAIIEEIGYLNKVLDSEFCS